MDDPKMTERCSECGIANGWHRRECKTGLGGMQPPPCQPQIARATFSTKFEDIASAASDADQTKTTKGVATTDTLCDEDAAALEALVSSLLEG